MLGVKCILGLGLWYGIWLKGQVVQRFWGVCDRAYMSCNITHQLVTVYQLVGKYSNLLFFCSPKIGLKRFLNHFCLIFPLSM